MTFQSTHPVRGGTAWLAPAFYPAGVSIHPPRAGWDRRACADGMGVGCFNPPTPCGVGPSSRPRPGSRGSFNPPTPCGVGQGHCMIYSREEGVSIHPPRAGWDGATIQHLANIAVSIHPPRAGWDDNSVAAAYTQDRFQSTHPVRGGTHSRQIRIHGTEVSIHPPRAGWDPPTGLHEGRGMTVSIHPPRAGWD